MLVVLTATLVVETAPGSSRAVAAVFPPWWSQARIAAAAASVGRIAAGGGAPFVVALHSDQPGLAARARASGAWLVVNPDLRGLCDQPAGPSANLGDKTR
jgi:hypothetical protein